MADSIDVIVGKALDEIHAILPQYTEAAVEKATRRCAEENASLRFALSNLLKEVVALYDAAAPGGSYDGGNRFADANTVVREARAALSTATQGAGQ